MDKTEFIQLEAFEVDEQDPDTIFEAAYDARQQQNQ